MKDLILKDFVALFSNLCCSSCKNDFTKDSLEIKNIKNNVLICNLSCKKCGKDFGDVILHINNKSTNHLPLEVIDGPDVINYDDVIKAHEFIKSMK